MTAGTCITYEDVYHHIHMIDDEISWRCYHWFTLKSKVQSLRLVTRSIQTPGFKNSSFLIVELNSVQQFGCQPTEMSKPWNSPTLEPTLGQWALQDQPCLVHLSPQHLITWINPTVYGRFLTCKPHVFFSEINAVLIKPQQQGETRRLWGHPDSQLNVHTSSSMTLKSSVSERQQLLKVKQGLLRPRYKFSSSHRPKWPLGEKGKKTACFSSMWFDGNIFDRTYKTNWIQKRKYRRKHYLPPPMANESKSPLMKKEFSPVHLNVCRVRWHNIFLEQVNIQKLHF